MNLSQTEIIGAVAIGVVLLLAIGIAVAVQRARSNRLRKSFGPEYDHVVKTSKNRTRAEAELKERRERARAWTVVPLSASDRDHFQGEWQRIESRFLDRPTTAVIEAEEMVGEIMTRRGYPPGDFEARASELSVDHPDLIPDFRAAHGATVRRDGREVSTEDLRQAMVRLRKVFEGVVGESIRSRVSQPLAARTDTPHIETPVVEQSDHRRDSIADRDPVLPRVIDDESRPR